MYGDLKMKYAMDWSNAKVLKAKMYGETKKSYEEIFRDIEKTAMTNLSRLLKIRPERLMNM